MKDYFEQLIASLYVAIFNRAPDKEGLDFWLGVAETSGLTDLELMNAIAEGFTEHPSFDQTYAGLGNVAFVDAIYQNIGGNEGDVAGKAFWIAQLEGGATRAEVVASFVFGVLTSDLTSPEFAGLSPEELADAQARQDFLQNQVTVGLAYVEALGVGSNLNASTDPFDLDSLLQDPAYLAALAILNGITDDPASIQAARDFLAGSPTVDDILNNFSPGVPGETLLLTPGQDSINITTPATIDTVKGLWDNSSSSTFTVGDNISGNGRTILELAVTATGDAPFVQMSGVDALDVIAGGAFSFDADASSWGTDISEVSLRGADGFSLDIENMTVEGSLDAMIAPASDSDMDLTGMMGDVEFYIYLNNSDADGVGTSATVGLAGIDATAGGDDYVYVGLYNYSQNSGGSAMVSDLTVGDVNLSGDGSGAEVTVSLYNYATASGDATAGDLNVGAVSIDLAMNADDGRLYAYNWVYVTGTGDATVGDTNIGDISIMLADGAEDGEVYVSNWAYVTGGASGSATAGSVTLGNITVEMGAGADDAEVSVYNYARARGTGNDAMVGDITVGDIDVVMGPDASDADYYFSNWANANLGNATAGNVTLGNISFEMGEGAEYPDVSVYNYASASGSGNAATVGNITVGDIDVAMAADASDAYFYFSNYAFARTGDATAGNITLGDVSIVQEDGADDADVSAYNTAYVSNTGDATVGDIMAGNLDLSAGVDGDVYGYFENYARAGSTDGDATVGDIVVGDVMLTAGSQADASFSLSQDARANAGAAVAGMITVGNISGQAGLGGDIYAGIYADVSGTSGDSLGDVSVGNIDFYGEPNADVGFYASFDVANGSISDVSFGDVTMAVDNDAAISFDISASAGEDIGEVSIGNVSMTLGTNASLDYFEVDLYAGGSIGGFGIGNVSIAAGTGATGGSDDFDIYAEDNLGDVTVGNASVSVGASASLSQTWGFRANTGSIGNIVMGDTTLTSAVQGGNERNLYFTADQAIGDVTVGDVSVQAAKSGYAYLSHDYRANDQIGSLTYGNIDIFANGGGDYNGWGYNYAALYVTAYDAASMGDLTVGDIDVAAQGGVGGEAYASAGFYMLEANINAGDVNLSVANVAANTNSAYAGAYLYTENGDINVGDISVTAGAVTANFNDAADGFAYLGLYNNFSGDGDVTIGNITVTGGGANGNDVVLDNLSTLLYTGADGWLDIDTNGTVTVGDVDYSGYEAASVIDVSGFEGAESIWASQGDSEITDNATKNEIYLGDGEDDVFMDTTGEIDFTDSANIDVIYNFTTGGEDLLTFDTAAAGGSDFALVSNPAADYAAFLDAAQAAMTNFGEDIYARSVEGDTFVALDNNQDGDLDFVVQLVGVETVEAADFAIV